MYAHGNKPDEPNWILEYVQIRKSYTKVTLGRAYNEFGDNEHLLTTSISVHWTRWQQCYKLQL